MAPVFPAFLMLTARRFSLTSSMCIPSTKKKKEIATVTMLAWLTVALTLLFRTRHVIAESATAESISGFAISGWWSDCDFFLEEFNECIGTYKAHDPFALDPTGNTCYVNPLADPSSTNVVFWFGPPGSDLVDNSTADATNIYYYVLLVPTEDAGLYIPTNCTDSGACSCESLDPLRGSWRTTGTCDVDCMSGVSDKLKDGDCAVFAKTSTINKYLNDTIVTCAIQGSLIDLSSNSSLTTAPTTMPTSGKTKIVNLSWLLLLGSGAMFAFLWI
jgi:hypothetical protein